MGNAISIGKVAGDPRLCGIQGPVSAIHAAERRTDEALAKAERDSRMDTHQLADIGHNRSGCNVLDSGRVRAAIGIFEARERGSAIRRFGIAGLIAWGLTSTALAVIMFAWIIDLQNDVMRLTSEVKQAYGIHQ
jgi:hypothetical protein